MTISEKDLKRLEGEAIAGRIRGYASAFDVLEPAYQTIFDLGAFRDWIRENEGAILPVYYWHDFHGRVPVGRCVVGVDLVEDDRGLKYEADIHSTGFGVDLLKAVITKSVDAASHSFRAIDKYQKDEVWHFTRVELVEFGPCPGAFAANPGTSCEIVDAPGLMSTSKPVRALPPAPIRFFREEKRKFLQEIKR